MIEQGIYFAIGCAVTALAALMFAPVFWNRALRLTRQRLQLQFPVSMQEIYAERDQLRAEFAIERVRLEQALGRVQAGKARDMADIGRRTMEASRLVDELEAVKRVEQEHEREIANLLRQLELREADSAALHARLEQAQAAPAGPDAALPALMLDDKGAAGFDGQANGSALADSQRRVRALEQEAVALRSALEAAREREKSAFLQSSLRAEKGRSADRAAAERLDMLRAENTALQSALDAVRGSPIGGSDGGLRGSIHALGLAVAAMTRETAGPGPRLEAAARQEPSAKQNVDAH